ncbi:MAG TPA: polysaccharide deacetylase family protein [Pyrinomonadaceae bacterium]|nr:polysaccharide deacetylase family protein [Pyrinomonadaceae bacterium]
MTGTLIKYLRRAGVQIGANAIYFSGVHGLPKAYYHFAKVKRHRERKVCPFAVLLYHRVNDFQDPFFPALPVSVFDAQMGYLATHFKVISLSRLLDQVDQGIGIEPRTVAITFDDGYRDNYLYAHPVLRKYGLPASLFVATGYTDTSRVMWNDRIAGAIKHTTRRFMNLELPDESLFVSLASDRSKLEALSSTLEKLKSLAESQKTIITEEIVQQLGNGGACCDRLMLGWAELREMRNSGWEVGSHTVEHRILTKISHSEMESEVTDSKKILEQELQTPITVLAYPNGKEQDFAAAIKESAQSAGYRAALTTMNGLNHEAFERFAIHRISPWEEELALFAVKLEWLFWKSVAECKVASFDPLI